MAAARAATEQRLAELKKRYAEAETRLSEVVAQTSLTRVTLAAVDGTEKELPTVDIFRAYRANELSFGGRVGVYASRLWEFLSRRPARVEHRGRHLPGDLRHRDDGHPHEHAGGAVRRARRALPARVRAAGRCSCALVRIAVNNLAGVPSIVFGVFGLGFFVYFVGGAIDQAFFPERLPTPTFGTGGILWASLTLGLLTVPVVIVASEEALAAVPRSMREASLAHGRHQVPDDPARRAARGGAGHPHRPDPGDGARRRRGGAADDHRRRQAGAGPAARTAAPFLHLERKFMHLGFHIYDVGFQSPNVEAAKPMVYATTILLLLIVVALNLTAIIVRNHLRKRKYSDVGASRQSDGPMMTGCTIQESRS